MALSIDRSTDITPSDEETLNEFSEKHTSPPDSGPKTRRSHKKSRSGCVVCKRRRIKCDEGKPECRRCQIHGVSCSYEPAEGNAVCRLRRLLQSQTVARSDSSLMLGGHESNIQYVLYSAGDRSSVSRENLEAVMRFEVFTSHTLGAPVARHIVRMNCIPLAFKVPHLMHAIIASSITHLSHVVPSYIPKKPAEYHWNRAISLFQQELDKPIDSTNIDAVISTTMMLAIHSFTNTNPDCAESWVFPSQNAGANWLYVAGGLQAIREKSGDHGDNTFWYPVFEHADNYVSKAQFDIDDIPLTFRRLCNIDECSNAANNPYYQPLRTLFILMALEPIPTNFARLVIFVGQMLTGYRELVLQKDAKALLILAYWFGLTSQVDQWWIQDRMRSECRAICIYLETFVEDPHILELLHFPALACGYRDVYSVGSM